MDIEELLQQKKRKLEELKKQRLAKQQDLLSQLSSSEKKDENNTKESDSEYSKLEEKPLVSKVETREADHENITIAIPLNHKRSDLPQSTVDVLPRLQYTKNTDTTELDEDVDFSLEHLKKQIERDVEKRLRKELEEKFRKDFDKAVKSLESLKYIQTEENLLSEETTESDTPNNLKYPNTKTKQITLCESDPARFLTLHDDCICIWKKKESDITFSDSIPLYTKTNVAIFDSGNSGKIITGSESGYVYIFDLSNKSHIRSNIQLSSIVSMYQSSGSLIVLTLDGNYAMLAMNLIDVLNPVVNFFTSLEYKTNSEVPITHENIVISASQFISANNVIIALLTGEVVSVDFGQRKLSVICNNADSSYKLPVMCLSYSAGKIIILGLDHTVKIVSATTGLNLFKTEDLPDLTFLAEWMTPSLVVTCSVQNVFTLWKLQNEKMINSKLTDIESPTDANLTLVSSIKALDATTLIVGDLKGKVYTVNVNY
ncbi:hypothetical protein PMKS-000683 [Pichia membranifaciens]|uniref:Striatin N-terminal domain-containing protein n=1 Tax=Pichia membranifaciens TaxID=4926 RepID=A0A1Q2YCF4_9ASCO|nr:hypothetical protein PMKS-000683 [Pichia membranifaciens]